MVLFVKKYCSITHKLIRLDGDVVFSYNEEDTYKKFIRAAYRHFETDYPKFFKMDALSKLGFLSVDILLKDENLVEKYSPEKIGLILTNGSSSLEVDEKHQETINDRENYFPSPSNFVYTLPNIMAGESAIRHTFRGENTVLISEGFDADLIFDIARLALENGSLDCCICGWVEQYGNNYESLLFLVERGSTKDVHGKSSEDVIFEPSFLLTTYKRLQ
jgi:3-oxoacyl-(acyl-carrier-protein) synthase